MSALKLRQRACGIVISGDHLLMVRHIHDGRDYWTFPGGGIENGESILQAAEREVLEETGLQIKARSHIYSFESDDNESHCVLMDSPTELLKLTLGVDPEESEVPEGQRMLQDVAWRKIADVNHHPIIAAVMEAAWREI